MAEINLSNEKTPMPSQDPKKRINNFDEVALGYTEDMALNEAKRCLNCKNMPCVSGCPVKVRIPEFIAKVRELDFEGAYKIISKSSSLPAVCGRVCTQESQCESKCVRSLKGEPVGIGRLERFVADYNHAKEIIVANKVQGNGIKVAIVGSGPAGLACAGELVSRGYNVTVFEALHEFGGVLLYGIPEFRLPKSVVKKEIQDLQRAGVHFEKDVVIGKTLLLDELKEQGFRAVFIGSGAGLPKFMGIPGENLNGVYSANEFLTRNNLMKAYENGSATPILKGGVVAVVGGGNVAMDAARTAVRLGAKKVYIIYRRSREELPARAEEVEHAEEEGIEFKFLTNPKEIIGYFNENDKFDRKNGFVQKIRCSKMSLGAPDERGRRRPIEILGSDFEIDASTVIMALGTNPNPVIRSSTKGIEFDSHGCFIVDENGMTSKAGVFAGGDAVTGAATVISAMGAGKHCAETIDKFIKGDKND